MKTKKAVATQKPGPVKAQESNDPAAVEAFLLELDHPLKPELELLRAAILDADRRITEGIKWNSPSFYFQGWFATFHLRARDALQIVFHLGAKARDNRTKRMTIDDPAGLLEWVAQERAVAKFKPGEAARKTAALKSIVQQWLKQLPG